MTDSEYFVGQVADLLGGKKKKSNTSSNEKLATLFNVKSKTNDSTRSTCETQNSKPKKSKHTKKPKKTDTDNAESGKLDTKPKKRKHAKKRKQIKPDTGDVKLDSNKQEKKKSKVSKQNTPERHKVSEKQASEGFCPPTGIVHESLMPKRSQENKAKKTKKRKHDENSDDEGEEVQKKRRKKHKRDKTKDKRTLFVGNLPLDSKKSTVKNLFGEFGKIESIRYRCPPVADPNVPKRVTVIKKEFHPGRSNIVSYVCFEDKSAAEKAVKLNGHNLSGFHLRVDLASNEKKHNKTNSVFIGNLSFDIEENDVWNHFEPCGEIDNVRIVRDRKTGLGKGFGYVLFEDKSSVDLAQKLHQSKLKGREIRVDKCVDSSKMTTAKSHPARQRLMKKAKKHGIKTTDVRPGEKKKGKKFGAPLPNTGPGEMKKPKRFGLKPTNMRPGEKRKDKTWKKHDKAKKSKSMNSVDKIFAAPRPMAKTSKHVKFD